MTETHLLVYMLLLVVGGSIVVVGILFDPDPPRGSNDANAYPRIFWGFMVAFLGLIGVLKYYQ